VAGTGVTINAVLPGPTMSDGVLAMWDHLYPGLDRDEQEARFVASGRAANSLLGRLIRPSEVANLITYLASDQASATTGAALSVDGGLVPTISPGPAESPRRGEPKARVFRVRPRKLFPERPEGSVLAGGIQDQSTALNK